MTNRLLTHGDTVAEQNHFFDHRDPFDRNGGHGQRQTETQKPERAIPALIECDLRGCSDRVVALRTVTPARVTAARPIHSQKQRPRVRTTEVTITCDMHGCSDRAVHARVDTPSAAMASAPMPASRATARASHAEVVLRCARLPRIASCPAAPGPERSSTPTAAAPARPSLSAAGRPGCPRQCCGCEASRYVFGEIRPELNLAYNWVRKFPRTAPAPGMVAARSGHVMVLISRAGGTTGWCMTAIPAAV